MTASPSTHSIAICFFFRVTLAHSGSDEPNNTYSPSGQRHVQDCDSTGSHSTAALTDSACPNAPLLKLDSTVRYSASLVKESPPLLGLSMMKMASKATKPVKCASSNSCSRLKCKSAPTIESRLVARFIH
ncbi:hypothetical protein C8Q72DRAFT_518569 [Fomitopsis betulina]|nr:hypothetical protein C8Q72DRAFT_518569 [Fomitopsis betulina]